MYVISDDTLSKNSLIYDSNTRQLERKASFFRRLFIVKYEYKSSQHLDYQGLFSLTSEVPIATVRVAIIKRVNKKKTCIQI